MCRYQTVNTFAVWYVRIVRNRTGYNPAMNNAQKEGEIMLTLQQLEDGNFMLTLDFTVGNNHIYKVWYFAEVELGELSTAEPNPDGQGFRFRIVAE